MIKSKGLFIFSIISALLLASCSSTKSDFALTEDATETKNEKTNAKKKQEQKQFVLFKYGNIGDYISVDETSIFTPNVFGSLKQTTTTQNGNISRSNIYNTGFDSYINKYSLSTSSFPIFSNTKKVGPDPDIIDSGYFCFINCNSL